jgi:two-component SAPR family response regulator
LKALIALGGRNVAAQQICDLLWPEADGDAAQAAFSTTLHRLRKLVRHEGAIRLSDSKLSLDPRLCWVDTWAFQRRASEAEADLESSGTPRCLAEAIDLYTGNFLAAESYPWVVPLRERLRGRFLRLVRHRGDLLKNEGDFDGAMKCYTRGLDADPLSEDIYQNLIRCCRQNGRHGEAASIYHRCCEALAGAGLKPSARTLQLLHSQPHKPPQ